jgi:hypothetical protein
MARRSSLIIAGLVLTVIAIRVGASAGVVLIGVSPPMLVP